MIAHFQDKWHMLYHWIKGLVGFFGCSIAAVFFAMMVMAGAQDAQENTSEPSHFHSGEFARQKMLGRLKSSAEVH